MQVTLSRPALWSFRETAILFGLSEEHGHRTISELVHCYGITPKRTPNPKIKGLDRADLKVIAKALNKKIDWSTCTIEPLGHSE